MRQRCRAHFRDLTTIILGTSTNGQRRTSSLSRSSRRQPSGIEGAQGITAETAARQRDLGAAALVLVALAGGCGERHHVENRVWTMFDIQEQVQQGGNIAMGPTLGAAGMPASAVLDKQPDGTATLAVVPAFAEGKPAAFVTTDLWINYGPQDVWLQPLYVQTEDGTANALLGPRIIDVGPRSTFYSPFWDLSLVTVGLVDEDHYRSSRDLLAAHLPTAKLTPHACPVRPLGANEVHATAPGTHLTEPTWGTVLEDIPEAEAWIDGTKIGLFDFGPGLFSFDPVQRFVVPLPFFLFVAPDAAGVVGPVPMAYRVGGVGPLFSGQAADVSVDPDTGHTQPHFGAFWRVHLALIPAGAGAFHTAEHPDVAPAGVDLKEYEGRMALDRRCLESSTSFATCDWLDSQAKVEAALGAANIIPTEIMGTCPFVFYDKQPVKR
jgi:hypothetical protein